MQSEVMRQKIINEIEPIINGMGFMLVELKFGRSRKQQHISIIIYRPESVGVNDCAALSKNLKPRLELIEGLDKLRLEVSSPGLKRVIKSRNEYKIFKGRGVHIFLNDGHSQCGGIITDIKGETLLLDKDGQITGIKFDDIRKARLDYTEEVSE